MPSWICDTTLLEGAAWLCSIFVQIQSADNCLPRAGRHGQRHLTSNSGSYIPYTTNLNTRRARAPPVCTRVPRQRTHASEAAESFPTWEGCVWWQRRVVLPAIKRHLRLTMAMRQQDKVHGPIPLTAKYPLDWNLHWKPKHITILSFSEPEKSG